VINPTAFSAQRNVRKGLGMLILHTALYATRKLRKGLAISTIRSPNPIFTNKDLACTARRGLPPVH